MKWVKAKHRRRDRFAADQEPTLHTPVFWCRTKMPEFEPGLPDCYQSIVVKVER